MKLIKNTLILLLLLSFSSSGKDNNFNEQCQFLNLSNIQEILTDSKSGVYINPFLNEKCFLLAFDELDYFDKGVINLKHNELYTSFMIFNKTLNISTYHHKINEDYYFDMIRFARNSSEYENFKLYMDFYSLYKEYGDFVIFFHEIYHLTPFKFNMSKYNKVKEEMNADIFSLTLLFKIKNISKDDFIKLTKNVFYLRTNSFSTEIKKIIPLEKNNLINFENFIINDFESFDEMINNAETINDILIITRKF